MSRSIGIPGNLEGAGAAMRLNVQKDKEGKNLIRLLCIPRKPTKKDSSTRNTDPELLAKLAAYCVRDVDTEVELFLKLPSLHPKERQFWCLNQKMNFRGFAVDRQLVGNALKLIAHESNRMDRRTLELTGGKLNSARQRNAVLKFIRHGGITLPDLKAQTVKEALKNTNPKGKERAYELLEIRDAISRSSTAKYAAFEIRSRSDGRARDNTIWFGAHTGRDAGTGLQPHNLFKTLLKQTDLEVGLELMKRGDRHAIEALFKPMELYASALRSCIIADKGKTLEVGDFATIEVRVLFWLANEKYGLEQIKSGRDLYIEMAAKIYGEDYDELLKAYKAGDKVAAQKRQLGKQTVLGAGFGIGVGGEKFLATALQYGLDIDLEIAQAAVRAYRELYPRVPIFWFNMESAAIRAIRNPGKRYRLGQVVWQMEGNRLTCQLPIGRKLSYFGARMGQKATLYGPKPCLEYLGVLSPSKIFGRVHSWGGKLVENAVQGCARDCLYEGLLEL
jgi:DNA polymerase bacteriophage-type